MWHAVRVCVCRVFELNSNSAGPVCCACGLVSVFWFRVVWFEGGHQLCASIYVIGEEGRGRRPKALIVCVCERVNVHVGPGGARRVCVCRVCVCVFELNSAGPVCGLLLCCAWVLCLCSAFVSCGLNQWLSAAHPSLPLSVWCSCKRDPCVDLVNSVSC